MGMIHSGTDTSEMTPRQLRELQEQEEDRAALLRLYKSEEMDTMGVGDVLEAIYYLSSVELMSLAQAVKVNDQWEIGRLVMEGVDAYANALAEKRVAKVNLAHLDGAYEVIGGNRG